MSTVLTRIRPLALLLALAAVGCGEDGKGLPDDGTCPEQPLYSYVFVPLDAGHGKLSADAGYWAVREPGTTKPNEGRMTPSEYAAQQKALNQATIVGSSGRRCLTPFGKAYSLDAGKPKTP